SPCESGRAGAAGGAGPGSGAQPRWRGGRRRGGGAPLQGPVTVRWMLRSGFDYQQAKERYQPFDALVDRDPQTRSELSAMATEAARLDVEMVVVVNNKAEGSSPLSVLELARQIVQESTAPNARSTSGSNTTTSDSSR
ncbi:MAG: hypothetical protein ACON4Z_09670, partial [Planctomycetota bacterium]